MKSFLKDYKKSDCGANEYNPVAMVNADLEIHQDWKIIQILSSFDNYHFYVVYEIKQPRKPREKKTDNNTVAQVAVNDLVYDETIDESKVDTNMKTDTIPLMTDIVSATQAVQVPKMTDLVSSQTDN